MKRLKKAFCTVLLLSMFLTSTAYAKMDGIDVSSWQTGIDISQVDCDFVITKATEGTNYINPDCDRVYQQAKTLGKCLGVYHFAKGGDPIAEANYFVNNVKGYIGEAILVLDYEGSAVNNGPLWANVFMTQVYNLTGIRPMLYTSASVISSYDWSKVRANDFGLWVAGYKYGYNTIYGYMSDIQIPYNTGAWGENVAMYQYTSRGRLNGYSGNLDLNVFYGDVNAWKRYAGAKESKIVWYTVQNGDSLYKIGYSTGCDWEEIARLNHISYPYSINVGQVIAIDITKRQTYTVDTDTVTPKARNIVWYTVQPGDTLVSIARRTGTPWECIATINNIAYPYTIYSGQVVAIDTSIRY